jgi:CRP-like cAMP-binding protein/sugar phosphate permease
MTAATAPAPSMFALFRKRDFSLLWVAQLVSTVGSSLTDLAAGILVYRITGSALSVGLMLMASAVPSLVVGLLAGVAVDRYDRKKIMIATDLVRAGLVASIPFLISFNVAFLYLIVLVASGVKQFFDPAQQSVLPDVASEEELAAANAFLSISSFGSTAIGFAAAGLLASISLDLAFWFDAATFIVSAACILFVRIAPNAAPEATNVRAVVENLRAGIRTLIDTPILRSTMLVFTPVLFAFGLWNVLLLPFAVKTLGGSEFQYGLQEGLTSLAFVAGSLIMARYIDRLAPGTWIVISLAAMGVAGIFYATAQDITIAILYVMISGFMQPPSSISRSLILQRNTPREFRGRVFSAFFVSRNVLFLLGMVAAGLADVIEIRLLIAASAVILIGSAGLAQLMPGLGRPAAEWRRAIQLLRTAPGATTTAVVRPATMADFDLLAGHLTTLSGLDPTRRQAFIEDATIRDVEAGTAIIKQGDAGDSAYFVLAGVLVAGIPEEDGGYRSLSTMVPGDFFGEIAALTGSPRTSNVLAEEPSTLMEIPAATLLGIMDLPAIHSLFMTTLTERLGRTTGADRPRLSGLDQEALRDLRTPRPSVEALPRSYHDDPAVG